MLRHFTRTRIDGRWAVPALQYLRQKVPVNVIQGILGVSIPELPLIAIDLPQYSGIHKKSNCVYQVPALIVVPRIEEKPGGLQVLIDGDEFHDCLCNLPYPGLPI